MARARKPKKENSEGLDARERTVTPATSEAAAPPVATTPIKPFANQIGASGSYADGLTYIDRLEENPIWANLPTRWQMIYRMKCIPQCHGMSLAHKLPIASSKFELGIPDDVDIDPQDQAECDAAEYFAREAFFNQPGITFKNLIVNILSAADWGNSIIEKVHANQVWNDGFSGPQLTHFYRQLPQRLTRTWWGSHTDEFENLKTIIQFAYFFNKETQRYSYEMREVDAKRFAVYVFQQEGSDYTGNSIFRTAYAPYYFWEKLVRIDTLHHQKNLGIPMLSKKLGATTQMTRDEINTMLQNIQVGNQAYAFLEEGYELGMLAMDTQKMSPLESMRYHDMLMYESIMANFLSVGGTKISMNASHESALAMYVDGMNHFADEVVDFLNKQVLWPLVRMNYSPVVMPRFTHVPLSVVNIDRFSDAMMKLGQVQGVIFDTGMRKFIRDFLGAPPEDVDEVGFLLKAISQKLLSGTQAGTGLPAVGGNPPPNGKVPPLPTGTPPLPTAAEEKARARGEVAGKRALVLSAARDMALALKGNNRRFPMLGRVEERLREYEIAARGFAVPGVARRVATELIETTRRAHQGLLGQVHTVSVAEGKAGELLDNL